MDISQYFHYIFTQQLDIVKVLPYTFCSSNRTDSNTSIHYILFDLVL